MMRVSLYVFCILVITALSGCNDRPALKPPANDAIGLHPSHMDTSLAATTDFYLYTNGGWLKNTVIPADLPEWNTFYYLQSKTFTQIRSALKKAPMPADDSISTYSENAIVLFRQSMDTLSRNSNGIRPLLPALERISQVQSKSELLQLIASDIAISAPFFFIQVGADIENGNRQITYLGPNDLGLKNRDDYILETERAEAIRRRYKIYINELIEKVHPAEDILNDFATTVLTLETMLAKAQAPLAYLQQPKHLNNRFTLTEADTMLPKMPPGALLKQWGLKKVPDTIIITQPEYFRRVHTLIDSLPLPALQQLTTWHTLHHSASYLSTELESKKWAFYKGFLQGSQQQQPADMRGIQMINQVLPEALGQWYASLPAFAKAKQEITQMTHYLIEAYKKRIKALPWMSSDTKNEALAKLTTLEIKVGFPASIEAYTVPTLSPNVPYFDNQMALRRWSRQRNLNQLMLSNKQQPWRLFAHQVNAQYFPDANEIIIPAALLQAPLYDISTNMAQNFGAIGAIIGHEITHALDKIGKQYDAKGQLRSWWSEEDHARFQESVTQMNMRYKALLGKDGISFHSELTQNENIADLGGILIAYDALDQWIEDYGRPPENKVLTAEQQFFMAWATTWRSKQRAEALLQQLQTDTHLPGPYRAILPLKQIQAFYDAFDIVPGDPEYTNPDDRISIW